MDWRHSLGTGNAEHLRGSPENRTQRREEIHTEIYCEGLANVVTEADKSRDLRSAGWRLKKSQRRPVSRRCHQAEGVPSCSAFLFSSGL